MRKPTQIILTILASTGACQHVSGATPSAVPDTTVTNLQELQVSGQRNQSDAKSTVPVHRLDNEAFLTEGITDIADAMKRLPGVNLRDYGGSGGMKTVSVRGLGSQHTGVIYDGAALSEVRGGQIDLSRYSLTNLSSISLNVGDADDIYIPARAMSAATTLTINTLRSPDMLSTRPELSVGMRFASFGTYNPSLRFAISNGSNLGMSLTGEYIHARNNYPFRLRNGSITTKEHRQNSQLNLGHAEWNGIWKPTSASQLQAKLYWFDNSRHLPGPVIYYNNVSHEQLRERNIFGQLAYNTRLGSHFSLRAVAKYNWSATRYSDLSPTYPDGVLDQHYYQREEYASATLLYRPVGGLSLSYAADFWHNSLASNLKTDNHPLRNSLLQALSVKWQWWRLTATARGLMSIIHDKSTTVPDGKTTDRLSPSVGISVQPLENAGWTVRVSYKDIFRMPTFNELYFDHYGSVKLQPEKTTQFNIGSTWHKNICSWLPDIELTVDAYLNRVRDKIVAIPYNMFVMTMTNLGKVRILGLDATATIDFHPAERHDIQLNANYSYQRAASRTDRAMTDWNKQVAYTPLNSGSWSVTWSNPWVNVAVHGTGCSGRYATNSNIASTRVAGYMETGLTLFRKFPIRKSNLDIRADIINALNKQYEIISRYPMPGRSFSISLTYQY